MPSRTLPSVFALTALVLALALWAAPGARAGTFDLDTTWAHAGLAASPADGSARWSAVAMLADGRLVAAGRTPGGQAAVARFTAAGELDTTWAGDQPVPGVLVVSAQVGVIPAALVVLPDGEVLLGATTVAVDSTPSLLVARLTADGHLDPAFATGGKLVTTSGPETELGGLAVADDGHIFVAATSSGSGTDRGLLLRLTAAGVRDAGFGAGGEVAFRLGGSGTTFSDLALDGAGRVYLAGSKAAAASVRHQLVVARVSAAGALDPAYGTAGFAVADLNGASPTIYDVAAQRLRVDAAGTALVVAAVKSTTGPATHLIGLARLTPAGVLDATFGTAGTRTQDVSPSHITDAAALATLPGGGFVVGGTMAVGTTSQFALAGYHEDGSPDTTLNPANVTAANAANLQVGTGGNDRIAALAVSPQGRLVAAGISQTPSEQDVSAIVRLGGDAHAPHAAVAVTWEQAVPGRAIRPGQTVAFDASASTDPDGAIAKYEWDIDGDGTFERTGVKVLGSYPHPTTAGVLLRVTDADGLTATSGATLRVEADQPPTVAFLTPAQPVAGKAFTVGAQAGDPDGTVVSYAFDLDGNGTYETGPGTLPLATTTINQKGPASVGVRVTDDEGATMTAKLALVVKDAPCVDNPTIKVERAVIITQGADVAGGAGCFHGVTSDKSGVRTTVWTTSGHFRVNGLEIDTLGASEAVLEWKRKQSGSKETISLKLVAKNARVEGTASKTDFMFHEGQIAWGLDGTTITGFAVDPSAGIGGLPLKVLGPPQLNADGSSTLDVLPGMPPELLGKTPSAPKHLVFGPSANASAVGAFSFKVDQIPLGVILLGPVTVTYGGVGTGDWMIDAEASIPYPIPTKVKGHLVIVAGHVKEVDLELQGALPTPTPIVINALGLHIDFGPKVAAKPECIQTVGLVETTPYESYRSLDYLVPFLRAQAVAHPEIYGSLFRQTFQRYPIPTFALCGHIALSLAEVLDADVGFGFARYDNPYPNLFFFHGQATIAKVIDAKINAEFTTEGYVHFDAAVEGGYPKKDPWINWSIGLDFEYFKKQFNAEAHATLEIVPLDFTTGAHVLVSSKGLAACLYFKTFLGTWRPGAGAVWGHGPTLYFFGCDVKDYKVVIKHALSGDTVIGDIVPVGAKASGHGIPVVDKMPTGGHGNSSGLVRLAGAAPSAAEVKAAAAQAAPDPVDIPAGLPGTVMAFKGAEGPPHVILHGPSGQVFDTGSGNAPVQEPGFAALKNHQLGITEVVIPTPAAGRWTVETAPDSARLVQAIQADGTRPVTATGKVTGSGHDRRLVYTVKGLPAGGRVEFAEAGDGGGGRIGIVKADGRGTLPFHPAGGAPGKREIQGLVYAKDGYLAARLPLGSYAAPAPQRPARAKKLTVRRSGKRLVLRWRGDRAAYTQSVDIRSGAGLNITRTVRRSTTSIVLPAAGTKLVVNVTGTTRSGLAGMPARFTTRVPAAKKKKAKKR